MTEQLASLLLPIDALLSHTDFILSDEPSSALVTLFRNMWFLCVLFQFTSGDGKDTAMAWQKPALARIAIKTTIIVLEAANDSIVSDLEYNPVIRKEYVETVRPHRSSFHSMILTNNANRLLANSAPYCNDIFPSVLPKFEASFLVKLFSCWVCMILRV